MPQHEIENAKFFSQWWEVQDNFNELYGQVEVATGATEIQSNIDSRKGASIPQGETEISSTITFPQSPPSEGFTIAGKGSTSTDPINNPTARNKNATILKWTGAASGTMMENTNTLNLQLKDLVLHGDDVADILLHFKSSTSGSGVSRISNINFYNAPTLIKCAEAIGDGTNADIYFENTGMQNATYGLEVVNSQGVNYNFSQLSARDIESVIRMTQGNNVVIQVGNFVNTGHTVNDNYSIHIENSSDNAYSSLIDMVRFEQDCDNFFYGKGIGSTIINALTEAQGSSASNKIKLRGHTLTINDSRIASWDDLVDMDFNSGVRSYMHFNRVYFSSIKSFDDIKDMFVLNVNAPMYITMRNCTSKNSGGTQRSLKDFNSSLTLGEVVHTATLTGGGVTGNAYLFGEVAQNQYNTLELPVGISILESAIVGTETGGAQIGATLKAVVEWSGSVLTVLNSNISGRWSDSADDFRTAEYVESVIGARVQITNETGTWDWVVTTKFGNDGGNAITAAPSSATDAGSAGEIKYTDTHIYVCTADDVWKRAAIATW